MTNPSFLDCMRLDDAQRARLMNGMDDRARAAAASARRNRRKQQRFPYRQRNVPVIVEQPSGASLRLLVCTRDISSGGLSFVHGQFLHKDSRCRMALPKLDGTIQAVEGTIVSCVFVEGKAHLVGVRFERELDPQCFAMPSNRQETSKENDQPLTADQQTIERFARQIEAQLTQPSLNKAIVLCTGLHDAAKAMGAHALAENAAVCASALRAAGSVAKTSWRLRRLVESCRAQ